MMDWGAWLASEFFMEEIKLPLLPCSLSVLQTASGGMVPEHKGYFEALLWVTGI